MTVEFRILGPFEVLKGNEPVDVGPHKQQSLLVLLLLHANRVVPTDRILEDLWGDDANGKENALWVYVSRLRSALESAGGNPEMLVTRDHGYVLNVEPEAIDARRFEHAVAQGHTLLARDPAAAAMVLRDALELWHGSPLQEFAYDDFTRAEIGHLENLRTEAVEDALDADLRCGKAGELIGELERLTETHPLRERPVSQLMLALYRSGRSADALRTFERFRRTIGEELGIDPSPELCRLEEQILLHDTRLQLHRPRHSATVMQRTTNPFRGLLAFSEEDVAVFFGRDRLVAETVRRLTDDDRLIALVGPSGSGKSSVVRAGLVPAIRKGAIEGSDRWSIAYMLPGTDPFIELEAALLRSTIDAPDSLSELLGSENDSGLMRAALRVLPTDTSRLLLIIDQFEELFTLVGDETVRQRFLDQIVAAVDDPYGRVLVVLTLRADFYRRALDHSAFATRMGSGIVNVVSLAPDELEEAALEPALRGGMTLEPALLADLVADVIGQPGALPMFQYTLTELFDRSVGGVLTADVYRSMGGVRGSLTRSADELFEQFDENKRIVAKQVLLRLVSITEQDEWSRRRVPASELVSLGIDVVAIQEVVERFARHRLLSLDRNQVTGAPTVEVAHEALLHEWERLRGWIEQNRDDLLCRRELAGAAVRWLDADRDSDYVYTGGRLNEALAWSEKSACALTTNERSFLDAGLVRREDETAREKERRTREQRLERVARWRSRAAITAAAVLVVVLGVAIWAATRPAGPKIALVYEGTESGSLQDLILDGWEQAERELGFEGAVVTPLIDPKESMHDLVEAGYELIVYGRFDGLHSAYGFAEESPNTPIVILDRQGPPTGSITSMLIEREGGAYLMGVAAALRSETGRIGFIGAWQTDTTEARRAAYVAGARSVNENISIDAIYLGPYHDPRSGFLDFDLVRSTASSMYRSGVDVIHHSAGDTVVGIAAVAAELGDELNRELWVIGSEVDEQLALPEYEDRFLTSMWKRWDRVVYESIRSYLDGELKPGNYELTMEGGYVDFSRNGGLGAADVAILDDVSAGIADGSISPPSAAREAPRWTRSPTITANLVFEDGLCSIGGPVPPLTAGDVFRVDIANRSDETVGVAMWAPDFGVDPDEVREGVSLATIGFLPDAMTKTSITEPGGSNAVAARLRSGSFFVDCFTVDGNTPGIAFTAGFETTCEGPAPESDSPIDVIRALGVAVNTRDADAVCSLFAEDAAVPGPVMAEMLTPTDDAMWFVKTTATDFEVTEGVITWTATMQGVTFEMQTRLRAEVVDGKILSLEEIRTE